jgi:hypothetical protein
MKLKQLKTNLIKLANKKQKQLDKRSERQKHLQELADKAFKNNKEQWEAFIVCIKHQQDKMLILIHDLVTIENLLTSIEKVERRGQHGFDTYA